MEHAEGGLPPDAGGVEVYLLEVGEARAHRHGRRRIVANSLACFLRRASAPRAMFALLATRPLPKEAIVKKLILLTYHNVRLCQMGESDQVRVSRSHTPAPWLVETVCPKTSN